MQPLIWETRPDGLRAPALICAFKGWNDAGDAASAALTFVGSSLAARRFAVVGPEQSAPPAVAGSSLPARRFAVIDPEEFFDFQATRPSVRNVEGRSREVTWP